MPRESLYLIQPAFTTGEVSPEVANRVDLNQFRSALLQAKNVYIRPYGAAYKRGGSLYLGEAKYADKSILLYPFTINASRSVLLEIGDKYIRVWDGDKYTGTELATPFTEDELTNLRFCQSADILYIASGTHPVYQLERHSETDWALKEFEFTCQYFDPTLGTLASDTNTLTPSGTTGDITITSKEDIFSEDMVGTWIKLDQEVGSVTVSLDGAGTSNPVKVGNGWKIITHGTWTGSIKIQKSINGGPWKDFREYKAKDDQNYSESGTITDENIRMRIVTTAGRADFTSLGYTNEGRVVITEVLSKTQAKCRVKKELSSTDTAEAYVFGSWNSRFGYPKCICFFQDRLCFAATSKRPFMVWMSKTGDYPNFSVEKVSGTVTDDSAVSLSFVSRNQISIKHIIPANDLIIMTDGNEWTVSGSETVTPTKATPRIQTARGCTDALPILIGNRIVFVQRRGETVRDMGYDYTSDSYNGMDLTLLSKHLTRERRITQAAYMQDPDSRLYFPESDGSMNVLTYVQDQKVYAWSHMETDGKYISACNIEGEKEDSIYTAVRRTVNGKEKTYIERLTNYMESADPMDYINLDSAAKLSFSAPSNTGNIPHLAGKTVGVLADGRFFSNVKVETDGSFTIGAACKTMIAGIPYEMIMELPNVESNTQQGTLQGRKKKISSITIRLVNSLGGYAGCTPEALDEIKYDEFQKQKVELYSGDKEITMPNPGFMTDGRAVIKSKDAYPFTMAAIIREMVLYE